MTYSAASRGSRFGHPREAACCAMVIVTFTAFVAAMNERLIRVMLIGGVVFRSGYGNRSWIVALLTIGVIGVILETGF